MTYLIAVVAVLGGTIIGWLIRHSILNRQLKQSRKQLEEIKTLQMNLEHDVAKARKKLMTQSQSQKKGKAATEPENNPEKQVSHHTIEQLTGQLTELKQENEDLQDQIGYLEAEKTSWLEYRNTAHDEIKRLLNEVQSLQEQIAELKSAESISSKSVQVEQRQTQMDIIVEQPRTSKGVMENTRKVNTGIKTDRVELVGESDAVDQDDSEKPGTTTTEHPPVEKQPAGKNTSPKKKPKTTRVDRSTNEIIDNFKRDLGLPDY